MHTSTFAAPGWLRPSECLKLKLEGGLAKPTVIIDYDIVC